MSKGKNKRGNKRTKTEREADLTAIAELYKRGWSMRAIASEVSKRRAYSITFAQVKYDLDDIFKRWREKQKQYIDNFVTVQLKQIQIMKQELWSEYLRSKKPMKKLFEKREAVIHTGVHAINPKEDLAEIELEEIFSDSTKPVVSTPSELEEVEPFMTDLNESNRVDVVQSIQHVERLGNPKYLELVAKLMEQEAKLLGFYNSDKLDSNTTVVIVKVPEPSSQEDYTPLGQHDSEEDYQSYEE